MKQLALRLEALNVESFPTTPAADAVRGTVQGHGDTEEPCVWPTTTLPSARPEECEVFPTTTLPTAREDECG